MLHNLRYHWVLWGLLVFLVSSGTAASYLSRLPTSVALPLTPNASVNVSVFRLFPHSLDFYLAFDRHAADGVGPLMSRPELGISHTKSDWRETGYLEFLESGEPIKISVQTRTEGSVFLALPAGGASESAIMREFHPVATGDTKDRVKWPPDNSLRPTLGAGNTTLHFSVIEVGERLSGEQATLVIQAPVGFKATAYNYSFLWWFYFWPFYAAFLAIYGAILLSRTLKVGRQTL